MGRGRAEVKSTTLQSSPSSSGSVGDELLYATMCMVGLPVCVQVKDGSVYSGIFHTACFQRDYDVVLKKAKREKKGNAIANLVDGVIIDTLVILSEDIVQVVARGVLLPVDSLGENRADRDLETVTGSILYHDGHEELKREQKALEAGVVTSKWITADGTPEIDQNRNLDPATESISSHGVTKINTDVGVLPETLPKPLESIAEAENWKMESICGTKIGAQSNIQVVSSVERQAGKEKPQLEEDGLDAHKGDKIVTEVPLGSIFIQSSDVPDSKASTSAVDIILPSSSGSLTLQTALTPRISGSATSSKEFKLNPGAKTFAPSFVHPITASSPASSIGTVGHVPNSSLAVPVGGVYPGVEVSPFLPRPSLPVKLVQCNNLVSGNSGSTPQYSLPIIGHLGLGGRQQPVRYSGQFQTGPAYVHPNPQTVMFGRMGGQVVYMHPITHDPIHSAALSQVPTRPLLPPHQAHLPKHQGTAAQTLQLCVAPVMAGVQQPFPVASHIPIQQTFPAIRPVPVPGGNGIFNSRF